jgi:hypothetical protein
MQFDSKGESGTDQRGPRGQRGNEFSGLAGKKEPSCANKIKSVTANLVNSFATGRSQIYESQAEVPTKLNGSRLGASDFADDCSHREVPIKHDNVIFAESALYEGYKRFVEVAKILHTGYGAALHDLVRTKVSELYLYGDASDSNRVVAAARERIFSISAT